MTIREAFEQGIVRGEKLSSLNHQLSDYVSSDEERQKVEKEIEYIEQEINEYLVTLGGTQKEYDGLTLRKRYV